MITPGHQTAKVACSYCTFYFYPGNIERHERSCLRQIERKRNRESARLEFEQRISRARTALGGDAVGRNPGSGIASDGASPPEVAGRDHSVPVVPALPSGGGR